MITGRNDNVVKGIDKKPKDDLGRRGLLETRWKRFKINGSYVYICEQHGDIGTNSGSLGPSELLSASNYSSAHNSCNFIIWDP